MAHVSITFETFLDGLFFPVSRKQKKKKKQKTGEAVIYRKKDATGDAVLAMTEQRARYWYSGRDYPEIVIVGTGADDGLDANDSIASLFEADAIHVEATLDQKEKALLAFRADDYLLFSATEAPKPAPNVLVRKKAIAGLEERLNGTGYADAAPSADKVEITHPAEFIVSRFFLPPRASFSAYTFAAVPARVSREYTVPQNTRHACIAASWNFSGKPLSVKYHLEFSPSDGAQTEKLVKAAVSALFREALLFWRAWRQPIDTPALVELTGQAAAPSASSVFLAADLRGETLLVPCVVELPPYFPDLVCRLSQTALTGQSGHARIFDIARANDSLFLMMKSTYKKAFLDSPKGAVPFGGPTIHGIFSLMNEVDRSIVIQNFLLARYDLKTLPFFFFYHEAIGKPEGETVYRLKPSVPLALGELEKYLSDSVRQEWNYNLRSGCMYRICPPGETARLNAEALANLALEGASGKLLLSEKAMCLLKEEILDPIDAKYQKELDELNAGKDTVERLAKCTPKLLTAMLLKFDNQSLAMACLGFPGVLDQLYRGMSASRQKDVREELGVATTRRKRGDITAHRLLEAKKRFIEAVRTMPEPSDGMVM